VTDIQAAVEALAQPFFEQGKAHVFASICCNKLYVGLAAPVTCRSCKTKPKAVALSPENLSEAAHLLEKP
jgi:hypothetical protein